MDYLQAEIKAQSELMSDFGGQRMRVILEQPLDLPEMPFIPYSFAGQEKARKSCMHDWSLKSI